MHEDILVVGEGVFEVTVMVNPVLSVLLPITRASELNSTGHTDNWGQGGEHGVVEHLGRCHLEGSISDLEVTDIRVCIALTFDVREGITGNWSNVAIPSVGEDDLVVVGEETFLFGEVLAIHGNLDKVLHVSVWKR